MKEFNLELAKAGHPVCTRDGKPVRIVCFDAKGNYPILALEDNNDEEIPRNYTNEGFYYKTETSSNDLMMVSEDKYSEDESVRGTLYEYFKRRKNEGVDETWYGISYDKILAWLEKQGEQKPVEWHREDEQNLNVCLSYIPDEFLRRWLTDAIHVKYDKSALSKVMLKT